MDESRELNIPDFLKNAHLIDTKKPTPEDIEYFEYQMEYLKRFGKGYGWCALGLSPTMEEALEDIKECLRTGKRSEKPWMRPKYEDGFIY